MEYTFINSKRKQISERSLMMSLGTILVPVRFRLENANHTYVYRVRRILQPKNSPYCREILWTGSHYSIWAILSIYRRKRESNCCCLSFGQNENIPKWINKYPNDGTFFTFPVQFLLLLDNTPSLQSTV